jgi:group I intron endonuclease
MYYIYKSTNKINGKYYIGRCKGPLKEREYKHWWYATNKKSNVPFPNALRKYGRENFVWDIIEETREDNNGEREIYWIGKLNPDYNATLGGDGGTLGRPCPEHVKEATRKSRIVAVRDRTTGKEYTSMKEAREDTGVLESSISRSLKYNGPKSRWEPLNS